MSQIDHIGIYVKDLDESVAFYQDFFGFPSHKKTQDGDISMVYLDMGGALLQLKQRPDPPKAGGEKYTHFAFYHPNYQGMLVKLQEKDIKYSIIGTDVGTRSANFQDPNGHSVEVMETHYSER